MGQVEYMRKNHPNHVNQLGTKTNKGGWDAIEKIPFCPQVGVTLNGGIKAGIRCGRVIREYPSLALQRINLIHCLSPWFILLRIIAPQKTLPSPITK